jgi:hypothetical protein
MKKVLMTILATGFMISNAMALEGTISQLKFDGTNDTIKFTLKKTSDNTDTSFYQIVGASPELMSSLTAAVLTAKSTNALVDAYIRTVGGIQGWGIVILK